MKKIIAVLLVALMVLTAVACSKKSTDETKTDTNTASGETNENKNDEPTTEPDPEPAAATVDPIVGTWELDIDATFAGQDQETIDMLKTMGYSMTLIFNADGTGVAKMTGEEDDAFEYTLADGMIMIDGVAQTYSIDGNKLIFEAEGETMIFNKK